ncbi:hypothetical protein A4A49_39061 [Nicotiana attenuata]|uniref:Uncharacterized protein n=1 Tax=Nicotiana attenuata TaxID=49451 RepID=A0A1J6K794_NICAT|nr:hypothetical protein A4A49_39061 [Nicotiana attenuata]
MRRQTRSMSSSPYSKSISIEKSSNMRRETRSMSLSPHSTPVLVEKSIDERNMRRQNRSNSVKVLESRKNVVGQSEKKKSKRVRVDDDQGKRKCVVEDKVNLGVKPKKKSKVQKAKKVKIPNKVCKIKEPVLPKKAPGVQPVDYERELHKLKADVKQLHNQLNSFMEYVSDKFKEVFELVNSKLGASEVKYGAHSEEDTSGHQDNNDSLSNMEFGGNEDVEMDGCKVGGSEGKDVPHSQGDTSEYHRNNIVLNAADQLGVNIMEEPSSVKVNVFVAKVTFTPDVAHACGIGVDEAAEEMKEQFEKEVAESQIVLYQPELLPEVSPQMEKERDVLQKPCSLRSLLYLI